MLTQYFNTNVIRTRTPKLNRQVDPESSKFKLKRVVVFIVDTFIVVNSLQK